MPVREATDDKHGQPLLAALFWIGAVLAPVAALLLMVAEDNGALRIAAVLALTSVVLIGLSTALRRGSTQGAPAVDEQLRDEIDELRRELRAEIAMAAQTAQQGVSEQVRWMHGAIEMLRSRLDEVASSPVRPAGPVHSGAGPASATGPAGSAAGTGSPTWSPARQDAPTAQPDRYGHPGPPGRSGPHLVQPPDGLVRHTETVQVTTRHTVVDPRGAGHVYGTAHRPAPREHWSAAPAADQEYWSAPSQGDWPVTRHASGPTPASEPEPSHHRAATASGTHRTASAPSTHRTTGEPSSHRAASAPGAQRAVGEPDIRQSSDDRRRRSQDDDDNYWSELSAGSRWATLRDGEQGQEARIGERRTAVRTGDFGTELRVEDRWAAVHRSGPAEDADRRTGPDRSTWRDPGGVGWAGSGAGTGPWRNALPSEPDGRADADWSASTPLAGGTPTSATWRRESAEPVYRRDTDERYGYPPVDDVPRAGGASYDRWR